MIHRFVFHNDELVPVEKARWSPGQAGLICGWGLFTTARIVQGEAFAYERHWRRLEKDAALTRVPLSYSSAKVRVHLQEVIRANKVQTGCARIYLVWNSPGYWKSDEKFQEVDLVITTADLPHYPDAVRLSHPSARASRGLAAGWRENHFLAEQRMGRRRSAARRI